MMRGLFTMVGMNPMQFGPLVKRSSKGSLSVFVEKSKIGRMVDFEFS